MKPKPHPPGFTLLETLVSLIIFSTGVVGLWWAMRQSFASDQRLRGRELVFDALVSESERLRGLSRESIDGLRDTAYDFSAAGKTARVRRTVLDSIRRDSILNPLSIDEGLRSVWRDRPVEVVLEAAIEPGGNTQRLFIVLPGYQWY